MISARTGRSRHLSSLRNLTVQFSFILLRVAWHGIMNIGEADVASYSLAGVVLSREHEPHQTGIPNTKHVCVRWSYPLEVNAASCCPRIMAPHSRFRCHSVEVRSPVLTGFCSQPTRTHRQSTHAAQLPSLYCRSIRDSFDFHGPFHTHSHSILWRKCRTQILVRTVTASPFILCGFKLEVHFARCSV